MEQNYKQILIVLAVFASGYWIYQKVDLSQRRENARMGMAVHIDSETLKENMKRPSPAPSSLNAEMKLAQTIDNSIVPTPKAQAMAPGPLSSPVGKLVVSVNPTPSSVDNDKLPTPSVQELRSQIAKIKANDFAALTGSLAEQYGTHAVQGLVAIASNQTAPFSQRYIALMSSVRLGGAGTIPLIEKMHSDKDPFIRRGLCLACIATNSEACGHFVENLSVNDAALIVRDACVDAVLRNVPSSHVFEQVILDPRNRSRSAPFPILYKALAGLSKNGAGSLSTLCQVANAYETPAWKAGITKATLNLTTNKSSDLLALCEGAKK